MLFMHADWDGPPRATSKGSATHKAIARALARGHRTLPSQQEIIDLVRPELTDLHGPMRQSLIHELVTSLGIYYRYFAPRRGVRFVGAEIAVSRGCLDLLFEEQGGGLIADEIKSGRWVDEHELRELGDQVILQTNGGLMRFGDCFLGTRAIVLGRVSESYMLTASGIRLPLVGVPAGKGVIA